VVVIAHGFEIQQQRRMAHHAQRRRAEQRAFHAVRGHVAQHSPRRPAGVAVRFLVVGKLEIEKPLDLLGRMEPAKDGSLGRREEVVGHR